MSLMFKTLMTAAALALLSQGALAGVHDAADFIPAWDVAAESCLRGDQMDCKIRDMLAEGLRDYFAVCPNEPDNPETTWRFQCTAQDQ